MALFQELGGYFEEVVKTGEKIIVRRYCSSLEKHLAWEYLLLEFI
jgi:hypothetical protein